MLPCCHWQNFMRLNISIKKLRMMVNQNLDQILFRQIHKPRCKKYLTSWIFAKLSFWSVRPKKNFKGPRMWFFQSLAEVQCFTVHAYMLTTSTVHSQRQGYSKSPFMSPQIPCASMYPQRVINGPQGNCVYTTYYMYAPKQWKLHELQ